MKITIFGATGDVGRQTVREALDRGHTVTAIARSLKALEALPGPLTRVTADLLADGGTAATLVSGQDAVIGALRPPAGHEPDLVRLTEALLVAGEKTGVPLFITGGAATLKLADGSGHTVLSAPDFLPDAVRPIAEACAAQDALLDRVKTANWTCLRPPAMLLHGPRTGNYALGSDTLVTDAQGQSQISYADFAVAMLDLVEAPAAPHRKLTAGWRAVPQALVS
ncbi:NAD(P)H-binding protein [Stappia taiwanensis]|uniref:NAD(P)H-binding protein n=1 Tax=Stappia taiwanensis TaxID=992267 RepID=A0A838XXX2_9HYPH|nr:NAD(P)H-binding protein [Stappia taiwanensis]MBA4613378.1 NAD(P)H-binding protein [Stappia taiwanensis]GGE82082.1 3-beta hydroxysteroid dehydrogenase [Stappia taiwanensis]